MTVKRKLYLSQKAINVVHDWFPDSGGEIDIDDLNDAFDGHYNDVHDPVMAEISSAVSAIDKVDVVIISLKGVD